MHISFILLVGVYDHYDTPILPNPLSSVRGKKKPTSTRDMANESLSLYLQHYHSCLSTGQFPQHYSIPDMGIEVVRIYNSLKCQMKSSREVGEMSQASIPIVSTPCVLIYVHINIICPILYCIFVFRVHVQIHKTLYWVGGKYN